MHSILAVDDSISMRQMVSFTLKNAGYEVVEAVDGEDAFEKARQRSFDLVLTDQNMPRLDGIGLTKRLREHPGFKTIPILILTTESSEQMKQAGRAAGATGWWLLNARHSISFAQAPILPNTAGCWKRNAHSAPVKVFTDCRWNLWRAISARVRKPPKPC
jgi:two-component system chemotaxis response regulator CheY